MIQFNIFTDPTPVLATSEVRNVSITFFAVDHFFLLFIEALFSHLILSSLRIIGRYSLTLISTKPSKHHCHHFCAHLNDPYSVLIKRNAVNTLHAFTKPSNDIVYSTGYVTLTHSPNAPLQTINTSKPLIETSLAS